MSVHTIIECLHRGYRVIFLRQFVKLFRTVKIYVCFYKVKTANT